MSDRDTRKADGSSGSLNRRKLLQGLGAAGAAGLAGCGGGDDGEEPSPRVETQVVTEIVEGERQTVIKTVQVTDEPSPTEVGAGLLDDTFTTAGHTSSTTPAQAQYNPFNPTQFDFNLSTLFVGGWLANITFSTGVIYNFVLDSWEKDGPIARMTLKDGHTWHDGKDLVADDMVHTFQLGAYFGSSLTDWVEDPSEDIRAVDDLTFEVELNSDIPESLMGLVAVGNDNKTGPNADGMKPPQHFSQFTESYLEATSDDEVQSVTNNLVSYTVEDPIGFGPFKLAERRSNSWWCERHDGYGDMVSNIPYLEQLFVDTGNQVAQLASADTLDGRAGSPRPEEVSTWGDHWHYTSAAVFGGQGAWWHFQHKDLSRLRVRQALSFAIDNEGLGTARAWRAVPIEHFVGVGLLEPSNFISQDVLDAAFKYKQADAEEMVPKLMEMEGYTMEGDEWVDPNGDPFSAQYNAPAGSGRLDPLGRVVTQSAGDFGFNLELLAVEGANYWSKVQSGDADMVACCWGERGSPHAIHDFQRSFTAEEQVDWMGMGDGDLMVPPVGGDPLAEPSVSVNPGELIDEWTEASPERGQEILDTLAWTFNQWLPMYPHSYGKRPDTYTTDHWNVPSEDSELFNFVPMTTWALNAGEISAKTN